MTFATEEIRNVLSMNFPQFHKVKEEQKYLMIPVSFRHRHNLGGINLGKVIALDQGTSEENVYFVICKIKEVVILWCMCLFYAFYAHSDPYLPQCVLAPSLDMICLEHP